MSKYVVRRLLLIFPTLVIASLIVHTMMRVLPGDAILFVLQESRGGAGLRSEEGKAIARAKVGLDRSFTVQYVAFILGWPAHEGRVLASRDDGETWGKGGDVPTDPLTRLRFISTAHGWAVGGKFVWGTLDSARLWQPLHLDTYNLNAVAYGDENNVWAVGENGRIIYSDNGGQRLTVALDLISTFKPQTSGTTLSLMDVAFLDAMNGWAVGDKGTVLHTSDGGQAWEAQASGTDQALRAIAALDTKTAVIAGDRGTVLRTTNGGQTWTPADVGTSQDLVSLSAVGNSLWLAGKHATLRSSADGGATWAAHEVKVADGRGGLATVKGDFLSVSFADAERGYVGGSGGLMVKSYDGGRTWERTHTGTGQPVTGLATTLTSQDRVRVFSAASQKSWKWGIVGNNWGTSLVGGRKVVEDLTRAFPPTFQLMIMTVVVSTTVAIPIGIISAIRQDTAADYLGRFIAIFGLAIPAFWLGTMVLIFPSVWFNWSPPLQYVGFPDNPLGNLGFFAMPVLVAGVFGSASVMRMTRSMMLEVLRQDYIRTAWSKGLRERVVIFRHALKNAMIPVITIIGMQIPYLLGNQVVIERLFNIPGLGRVLLDAVNSRDYPIVQGINLFLAFFIVAANLLVDLTYGWLDPRIRYD